MSELRILTDAPALTGVHVEEVSLPGTFLDAAACFAPLDGTVLLTSGGGHQSARWHVLGALPWLTLAAQAGGGGTLTVAGNIEPFRGDPFAVLDQVLQRFRLPTTPRTAPLTAGLLGYLAYDLKDHLEDLPNTCIDDLRLPTMLLHAPSLLLVQDARTEATRLLVPCFDGDLAGAARTVARFHEILAAPPAPVDPPVAGLPASDISRPAYEQAVRDIVELIAAGSVYQVNFTQRFAAPFAGDPFALFERLLERNPAPFFSFVQGGDHQVVSTSPERFLHRRGDRVESHPIKGTRPRGTSPAEDRALHDALLASEKDAAELSMIVDLVRNDLGKVCRPGSVAVPEHKRLESYHNVHHLVSVVTGQLADGCDSVDLLRAAFPGGSITGCPKIRAMGIIDRLEAHRRHVYCGSIGYLGFDETLDLSIAIRTATITGGTLLWSVGGGVVYDSDPADEYEESMHKGRTLSESCADNALPELVVWHNGRLVPQSQATVPVTDLGLRRGYGLFETLRADDGTAPLLANHLARLEKSWRALMPSPPPDLDWADIIRLTVAANSLLDQPALVRILATRGSRDEAPWDHSLTVMVEPYVHRLEQFGTPGLRLGTYPEPRQTPVAAHKTLSYVYYMQAGAWARERGYHEALILNPDGTVSEGHSTGLLLIVGKTVIRPESPAALPSVMAAAVCRQLEAWGYAIEVAPIRVQDLLEADLVVSTSGMMGAVPVMAIDGIERSIDSDLWQRVNDAIVPGWRGRRR